MKKYVKHDWHNQWIIENIFSYSSYHEAADAYRRIFSIDISSSALKKHCTYTLQIRKPRDKNYRHITKEQAEWLKDVYPKVGVLETQKMWNDRYNDDLSATCIKQIARRIGCVVSNEVAIANKLNAAHKEGSKRSLRRIGDTRMECGRMVMKAEDGNWKSAGRCVWEKANGKIPKGYAIVALDGDTTNVRLDNLEMVPLTYIGKLQRNNFFSSNPEITRTGIIWCDLDTVLVSSIREDGNGKTVQTKTKTAGGVSE